MFKSRIIVTPLVSDAVSHLEWDSVSLEMHHAYRSKPSKLYTETEVTYENFIALCNEAHNRGSWGSALSYWKKDRVEKIKARDLVEFRDLVANMHPDQKKRWLAMFADSVRADGGPTLL